MIRNFFHYVVTNFGFEDTTDFSNSLLHSKLMLFTIPIAGISSVIERFLGLQSLTILAFVVLVSIELLTGLTAAKVSGKKIESKKFGRFGLKIFVWVSLLFILNSLKLEYSSHEDFFGDTAYGLFNWLHGTLFIYINIEYLISVLENIGTISGKDNSGVIDKIKDKLNNKK
ncbi:MAG: hypothetical protein GTN59_11720 [Candidatus Dadabacteria bacterium]|nr:hypothetical protein [Candidatus Dadabacteria bacterium]